MESKGDAKWDGKYRKWGQVDIFKSQLATEFAPSKNNESADVWEIPLETDKYFRARAHFSFWELTI